MNIPTIPFDYEENLPLVRDREDYEITVFVNGQALFTMTNKTITFHTALEEKKTSAGQELHFEV